MLKPRIASLNHEEAFLQRYTRLHSWALRLVQNDQELAEDLLHDVFLQFTVSQPDLNSIDNLDGYLRTMLRNMHLSQLRRASRMREATRPLIDYESATAGLETLKHKTEIQASDELRRICEYALLRKNTSKAGSVLILRFFHGYYPAEIAQVLHKSRGVVDEALRTARAEAKAYLSDPNSLAFMTEKPTEEPVAFSSARDDEDVLLSLRELIFRAPTGKCITLDDLHELFRAKDPEGIDCRTLAHIVSCEVCLDAVNEMLGLPLLSTRQPGKTLRKDMRSHKKSGGGGPPTGGSSTGGGGMDRFVSRHRKRVKEVLEHHPQELRISVNGFIVGAHTVNSELSKQTLTVNLEERISFVEIFSEREVRLLFCGIEPPPDGPGAYKEVVRLNEGRTLELNLDFAESHPQIHVVYHDPSYQVAPVTQADSRGTEDTAPASAPGEPRSQKVIALRERLTSLVKSLRASLVNPRFWLRPATVAGLFALILIVGLAVLYWRVPTPTVTVAGVLQKAIAAEQTDATRADQILHRTIDLEEKNAKGELITRRRIEVWQSAEKGITARRLYDDHGALLAGDWRRADGVQTIYHHGAQPKLKLTPDSKELAAVTFDNVWQLSPSAKEFSSLIGSADGTRLEEKSNSYVISFAGSVPTNAQGLVKATLVLARTDLHATEETLLLQQGNEMREYRFVEASFERHAPSTVAPAAFDPDPDLVSSAEKRVEPAKEKNAVLPSQPLAVPAPAMATPELEVEVLRLLNQVGADVGEQVSVTRTPQEGLRVEGVVETDKRKREILAALAPVKTNLAVKVEVQTVEEALSRQSKKQSLSGPAAITSTTATANAIPVDEELRRYFAKQGLSGAQIDDEERLFASRALGRSLRAIQHAWAIKRLTSRFSVEELRALDPESRAKWLAMIRGHARAIHQELAMLRQGLMPVFPIPDAGLAPSTIDISDDKALSAAAERLIDLCSANDTVLRSALTISSDTSRASSIKTSRFWRSINDAESLAASLANSR